MATRRTSLSWLRSICWKLCRLALLTQSCICGQAAPHAESGEGRHLGECPAGSLTMHTCLHAA